MSRIRFRVALSALLGVSVLAPCAMAQTQASAAPTMQGMTMAAMHTADGPADTEMMDGMQRMQHDMMTAPRTGDADHDFVSMMLPHHQGAVSMAKVELAHGKDPALLKLAHDIIAAQDREIAFMKRWLATHPGTVPAGTAR